MIWRHGKCGYKPLRDKVCPSKVCVSRGVVSSCVSVPPAQNDRKQRRRQHCYTGRYSYLAMVPTCDHVSQELMTEEHSQLHTQMSFGAYNISVDSSGNSIQPLGLTQSEAYSKGKPRFAEFCCNNIEVSTFHSINKGGSSSLPRSTVTWHW
jgi:telomerase reverse transcriptase